jgi:hypothetical protein
LFGRGFLACDGPIIASRQWLYVKPYFSYRGQRYTLFLILGVCVENLVDKLRGSQENVKEAEREPLYPTPDDSMAR